MTNGDKRLAVRRAELRDLALQLDPWQVRLLLFVGYALRRLRSSSSADQTSSSSSVR
jgi:hypothetical protein